MLLVRKLVQALLVVSAITFVGFAVFQFVGDPITNMTGPETTEADRALMRQRLGLDQPVYTQFGRYLLRVASGDFGMSFVHKRPVIELLAERVSATLEIVVLAVAVSTALAFPMGAYCAVVRKGAATSAILAVSVLGVAIPTFLIAIGLVLVFSVWLEWLPSFGRGDTRELFGAQWGFLTFEGWKHALLPALVMCLFQLGVAVRLIRGEMLEVLKSDFIRFCWARGLPRRTVYRAHALRNTLVPVVTTLGVQTSSLLAFSVVTERVFQWPGLGQLLLQSIEFSDVPMLSAYLIFIGLVFMAMNLTVDIAYYWLDPRVRKAA